MEPAPFAKVDATTLRWLPSAGPPPVWELRSGATLVVAIGWAASGGSLASARTASGTWSLKRVGFLAPRITARTAGAEANVAVLSAHVAYHAIDLADGSSFRLRRAGVALPAWVLTAGAGVEVAHIEPVGEGRTLAGGAVVVPPEATRRPELGLLLAISWYFVVTAWAEEYARERLVALEQRVGAPGSEASGGRD